MAKRIVKPKVRVRKAPGSFKTDFSAYNISDRFDENDTAIKTVPQLLSAIESGRASVTPIVHGYSKRERGVIQKKISQKSFVESFKRKSNPFSKVNLREGFDGFGNGADIGAQIQDDFIPILGGPFFKQLYQTDYTKAQSLAYYAANHDPIARALINLVIEFTLGRGFEIQCDNVIAMGAWNAFEKANRIQHMMHQIAREIQYYGETMIYKLPHMQSQIRFNVPAGEIPTGAIPRVRVIDPSNIWEIVTIPEDIQSVLYYVWLAPTQWQTYSSLGGKNVGSSKFIFQTIDAKEMMHFKINSVSNEKRGRSDLFPILGYLKRLRDSVNYAILSQQKQSAWSIDTTIEGSQADLDAYVAELDAIGSIPNSASEFVHTDKVKREMLEGKGTHGSSDSFLWNLSMCCAGYGVPTNYLGTHLTGGQTRAGSVVATEPFVKKIEMRQNVYREILKQLWDYCMEWAGIKGQECKIILPEMVVQDRSAKLKDLAVAVSQKWISRATAAEIAAKELGLDKFNFEDEDKKIEEDLPALDPTTISPLLNPEANPEVPPADPSGITSGEKKDIGTP
jgi:hypothetical protein